MMPSVIFLGSARANFELFGPKPSKYWTNIKNKKTVIYFILFIVYK